MTDAGCICFGVVAAPQPPSKCPAVNGTNGGKVCVILSPLAAPSGLIAQPSLNNFVRRCRVIMAALAKNSGQLWISVGAGRGGDVRCGRQTPAGRRRSVLGNISV